MNDIKAAIEASISKFGAKKTKEIIDNIINNNTTQTFKSRCHNCDEKLEWISEASPSSLRSCSNCVARYIAIHGHCRTMKRSGRSGMKKISLRYYDKQQNQYLIDWTDRTSMADLLDIKSRDTFNLLIFIKKETSPECSLSLENQTTGRIYKSKNARIYRLNEQPPNVKEFSH